MNAPERTTQNSDTQRLARHLFQLSGVMPLTAFALLHSVLYATLAMRGGLALAPSFLASPWYFPVELLLIWVPLVWHAAYGSWLIVKRRPNRDSNPTLLVRISRVCALFALGFIAYHFVHFRVPVLAGTLAREDVVQHLYAELSSTRAGVPFYAILHVAGLATTAFHMGFGIYSHAAEPHTGSSSAKLRTLVAAALGVGLFTMGSAAVIRIAAGAVLP